MRRKNNVEIGAELSPGSTSSTANARGNMQGGFREIKFDAKASFSRRAIPDGAGLWSRPRGLDLGSGFRNENVPLVEAVLLMACTILEIIPVLHCLHAAPRSPPALCLHRLPNATCIHRLCGLANRIGWCDRQKTRARQSHRELLRQCRIPNHVGEGCYITMCFIHA